MRTLLLPLLFATAALIAPAADILSDNELAAQMEKTLRDSLEYNMEVLEAVQQQKGDRDFSNTAREINTQLTNRREAIIQEGKNFFEYLREHKKTPVALPRYDQMMSNYRQANLILLDQIVRSLDEQLGMDNRENPAELFVFQHRYGHDKHLHRDTQFRIREQLQLMADLLNQVAQTLAGVNNEETAAQAQENLSPTSARYENVCLETSLYVHDDPEGASSILPDMEKEYKEGCRAILEQVERLKQQDCYGDENLQSLIQQLSHLAS